MRGSGTTERRRATTALAHVVRSEVRARRVRVFGCLHVVGELGRALRRELEGRHRIVSIRLGGVAEHGRHHRNGPSEKICWLFTSFFGLFWLQKVLFLRQERGPRSRLLNRGCNGGSSSRFGAGSGSDVRYAAGDGAHSRMLEYLCDGRSGARM